MARRDLGAGAAVAPRPGQRLSPLVRRLLAEHGVDSDLLTGTGRGGRITPDDVHAHAHRGEGAPPSASSGRHECTEALSARRREHAHDVQDAFAATAQLTSALEVDLTGVVACCVETAEPARRRIGHPLTPFAFVAYSVVRALLQHPKLNAQVDSDAGRATFHNHVALGVGVDTGDSSVVPDAQTLDLLALAVRLREAAVRAEARGHGADGRVTATFTLIDRVAAGVAFETLIARPPAVATLAVGAIERRPVVVAGELGDRIALRDRGWLCLSYDHRLVDGADAAGFLTALSELVVASTQSLDLEALR